MSQVQKKIAALFVVIGIVAIGFAAYLYLVPAIPPEYVGNAKATISGITTRHTTSTTNGRTSNDTEYTVLIDYEIDGQSFNRPLGFYSADMYVGQEVDIQYDTRNPARAVSPMARMIGEIIAAALGLVFIVVGVILLKKPVPVYVNGRQVA